ncbi:hypothetical protein HDV00_000560 [Rhizophlyctis rosea]|nr:hypothetical protein HDV00_000560 [Rhizophlyctis rosea]
MGNWYGGHAAVVKTLLDAGTDVHGLVGEIVQTVVRLRNPVTLELIVNARRTELDLDQILRETAKEGSDFMVEVLLDAGARVHDDGANGALAWAALRGDLEMVEAMLETDVCREACDTALVIAAARGHVGIVSTLSDRLLDLAASG